MHVFNIIVFDESIGKLKHFKVKVTSFLEVFLRMYQETFNHITACQV